MYTGTGWKNCEMRTYSFDMRNSEAIANATIIEVPESISRRKHDLRPLSQDEQLELREVAQRTWAAEGYIVIPAANFLGDHPDAAPHAGLATEKTAFPSPTPFQNRHNSERVVAPRVKSLL
jgi:hypothetical protein